MNTNEFWFSASSIKEYQQCGLKFKYGRIDKRERAETYSHHRWFGTLVHSTIYSTAATLEVTEPNAKGYRDKLYRLKPDIAEAFPTKFFEALWQEKDVDDAEIMAIREELGSKPIGAFTSGKIKSLADGLSQADLEKGWKAEAKKMVKNGVSVLRDIETIQEFEKKVFFKLQGRNFIGVCDVIAMKDGRIAFYDFKTSWDKPYAKLERDFQFFAYAIALKNKLKLDYWPKGYYVHLRSGDCLEYELTPDMYKKGLKQLDRVFSDMEADVFLPDYGGSLCQFCDFRLICYGSEDKIWRRK